MVGSYILNVAGVIGTAKRRGTRVLAPGVAVSYSLGGQQREARIKNISPTGVFLQTEDRWPIDSVVLLTMKDVIPSQQQPEIQVCMPARTVRHDDDGVGMEFVLDSISTGQWLDLFSRAASLTSRNSPVRVFRIAKALAFLLRIAPSAETDILSVITKGMSQPRAERAIDILLNAEGLLASSAAAQKMVLSPVLVRQVLEEGSRSQDEQVQQCWAGMLASACLNEADRNANRAFVGLLSELAPIHIRILDAAVARAIAMGWEPGSVLRESLYCPIEEISEITGIGDLNEIDGALDYLDGLGLLEMTVRTAASEQVNFTPTLLGFKFHAKCGGNAGEPRSRVPAQS